MAKRPLQEDQVTLKVKKVKLSDKASKSTPNTTEADPSGTVTEHGIAKTSSSSGAPTSPTPLLPLSSNLDSLSDECEDYNLNNQLSSLEHFLSTEDNNNILDENSSNENSGSDNVEPSILGLENQNFWSPHPKILEWYAKVSDMHLNDSILKQINEKFTPPPELASFFSPAKLPDPIWSAVKDSKYDGYKHRILFSLQSNLLNSLKPLLDCLPSIADSETKEKIAQSIQMISSVNLDINRFRRVIAAPHLKTEYKKSFCKLPVTRSSLFGEEDFEKSSDKIIKEYNASQKILKSKFTPKWNQYSNSNANNSKTQMPFRGGKGGARGKGSRGRGRGPRGGGRGSWSASGTVQTGQSSSNSHSSTASNSSSQ